MSGPEEPDAAPETILCDTSFVSVVQSSGVLPSWPADVRARVDAGVLAINVVTLAELRDGHIYADWGPSRRARAEQLIGSYLLVPLDMATVNECARLPAEWCPATSTSTPSLTWTTSGSTRHGGIGESR